jgi:cyclomaltodextrin glucanotransferase
MWLDKGVDAFRIDTVKHMPMWFWQEFTGDMKVHRPDLFMFGEWFQGGCWDPLSVEFAGKSGMSILDFSFRNALVSALANKSQRGFVDVGDVVDLDHLFRDASELVTFVDNHDLPRFLSISDDPERFRIALLLLMVSRGIPCIYYGNEQLLHCDTNGGNDPFNRPMMNGFQPTQLQKELASLAELRRSSPAIQKGGMRTKWIDADRWIVTRAYLGSAVLFAANRSDSDAAIEVTQVELPDGTYADYLGGPSIKVVGHSATVQIPARSMVVYHHEQALPRGPSTVDFQVHGICTNFGEEIYVCGDAPELGAWDVRKAVRMEYINAANWATTVAFDHSRNVETHYKYLIRRDGGFVREPGRGHHRCVPKQGFAIWRDQWRT